MLLLHKRIHLIFPQAILAVGDRELWNEHLRRIATNVHNNDTLNVAAKFSSNSTTYVTHRFDDECIAADEYVPQNEQTEKLPSVSFFSPTNAKPITSNKRNIDVALFQVGSQV